MHKQYEQIKKCKILGTRKIDFTGFYLDKVYTCDLFVNN